MMEVRVAGKLANIAEAVNEVRHVHPSAPEPGEGPEHLSEEFRQFMLTLLQRGESRHVFLWLLQVTLDLSAPEYWWHQAQPYFSDLAWVRRHPTTKGRRALLTQEDFEGGIPQPVLETLNERIIEEQRELLEASLPENFIRRAYVHTDYAELRRLYIDRGHYDSGHWRDLAAFVQTLRYSDLITVTA